MSTSHQRQQIGYMRKLLGLDDDTYREMLSQYNSAESSKDLSVYDANILLNKLCDMAKNAGTFQSKASTRMKQYKYNNLGYRSGMASPAQLRKIEAMWFNVSYSKTDEARVKGLNTMVKRITGKDSLKFITCSDVSKLIKAIEEMGKINRKVNKDAAAN